MRKAPSPFSLCPLQNGSAQSGSLRLLHGRPVLLCRDISGRCAGQRSVDAGVVAVFKKTSALR